MAKKIISTWLCLDEKGEDSVYYQVGGKSSSLSFQAVYWRCVFDFFVYARRYNQEYTYLLFINREIPHIQVDGVDVPEALKALGVEIVCVPFTYRLPQGYYGSWRNQLFEMDIFNYCTGRFDDDAIILLLDSDCLLMQPVDDLFRIAGERGCITYIMEYAPDKNINGITRKDMKLIYEELLGRSLSEIPVYHAGEFAMLTIQSLKKVMAGFELIFAMMIKRFESGNSLKFNEEAHFLSYLYYVNGFTGGEANSFIKRMWNSLNFYNIEPGDDQFAIWHLPASKQTGFLKLFNNYKRYTSLPNEKYRKLLKKMFLMKRSKIVMFCEKLYAKLRSAICNFLVK